MPICFIYSFIFIIVNVNVCDRMRALFLQHFPTEAQDQNLSLLCFCASISLKLFMLTEVFKFSFKLTECMLVCV